MTDSLLFERQFFNTMLETLQTAVVACDREGRLTFSNPAAHDIYGPLAPGMPLRDLAAYMTMTAGNGKKDVSPDHQFPLSRALRGESVSGLEVVVAAPEKPAHTLLVNASPLRDSSGNIIGAVSALLDITGERQRAASFERQSRLLDLAPVAIIVRQHSGTIEYWNRGAEEMYGWTAAEALGKISHELIDTRFPTTLEDVLADLRRDGHWQGELNHRRRDGSRIDVVSRWAVDRSSDGGPERALEINTDISARKQAEALLLRRTEELARSNAELERFAYVASHDLQEPLRMVASYTQLLADRYKGQLDERADKYIHFAVDGALRMQRLIRDLLAHSRIGSAEQNFSQVDTEKLLDQALQNLAASLTQTDGEVTHDPLPTVWADGVQLAQVFQNLLGNALKFRGTQAPRIHVSAMRSGDYWLFSFRDNGIGIPPDSHEAVFEIFRRLHSAAEYPGTGMGLALCKKIIERHGGRIWVESKPEQGSTFFFTLPRTAAPHASE